MYYALWANKDACLLTSLHLFSDIRSTKVTLDGTTRQALNETQISRSRQYSAPNVSLTVEDWDIFTMKYEGTLRDLSNCAISMTLCDR